AGRATLAIAPVPERASPEAFLYQERLGQPVCRIPRDPPRITARDALRGGGLPVRRWHTRTGASPIPIGSSPPTSYPAGGMPARGRLQSTAFCISVLMFLANAAGSAGRLPSAIKAWSRSRRLQVE